MAQQQQQLLSNLDLLVESDRLLTFKNWPYRACLVRPEDLAQSGFYYLGFLDRAQCFSCNAILSNWDFGDIVDECHRIHSPQCRMVRGKEVRNKPIITSASNDSDSPPSERMMRHNSQTQSDPTHPSLSEEQRRSDEMNANQPMSTSQEYQQTADSNNDQSQFTLQGATIERANIGDHYQYYDQRVFQIDGESSSLTQGMVCELQAELKNQARAASEDIKLPINVQQSITPVTLEITTNLMQAFENPDDTGHGHRREDFLNALARPEGDVILEELFLHAQRRAEQEVSHLYGQRKENNIRIFGNIIGVIGQAGIGKTTLTKMFAKRILNDAILMAEYLFYIPLRYVNFLRDTSLVRFLVTSSSCEWNKGEKCDKELLEELKENPNVVVIFDGLDEANMDLTKPPIIAAPVDKPEIFIKSILTGKLLSHAKKLVTSRPRQFYDMIAEYRPSFIVAISGLSRESQIHLCRELCGDDHLRVIQYLEKHRNIFAYCYVPVNCILTMHCVHKSFEERIGVDLNSITSILSYAFDKFLRSPIIRESGSTVVHCQFEPEKLCHLAWNGFSKKKIIFSANDLKEVNIGDNMLNAFLQTDVDTDIKFRILEQDKYSYFSHLIWQEFFTAIELMYFMPIYNFHQEMHNFGTSRWENVTKFMFGICNHATHSRLNRLFPDSVNQEEKRLVLKGFAFDSMPAVHENDSTPSLLRVCDWIAEGGIETFTKTIVDALPEVIKLRGSIHSGDVSNLHYVLRATQKAHTIKAGFGFNMIQFTGESFERFFEEMAVTLQRPNLKLTVLKIINSNICCPGMQHLSRCLQYLEELTIFQSHLAPSHLHILSQGIQNYNVSIKELQVMFDDENEQGCIALASCIPYTETVDVRFSSISQDGYRILSEAIQAREHPLHLLVFRGNTIDDEAAEAISLCLHKVESLNIEANELTANGAEKIARAIRNREETKLKLLKCNRSLIGNQGGIAISSCLEKIQNLMMMYCGITSVGVEEISNTLRSLQHPLQTLDLSANSIDDIGANALSLGLNKINNLILINCSIKWRGIRVLSNAIASLENPMEEFNIGFNKIGDKGVEALLGCLSKIEHLNISGCDINETGVRKLSCAISSLGDHSMKLTLDKNLFGDEGADAISVNLSNIRCLRLKRCGITAAGIKSISDSIISSQILMEELDISENNIGDTGVQAISSSLRYIQCLFIVSCGVTSEGAKWLSDALDQLPHSMKKLSLKSNNIGSDGGISLSNCLHKLQSLDITQCSITTGAGVMAMSKAIKAMNDGNYCSVVGLYAQ